MSVLQLGLLRHTKKRSWLCGCYLERGTVIFFSSTPTLVMASSVPNVIVLMVGSIIIEVHQ